MPEIEFYPLQSLSNWLSAEPDGDGHLGVAAFRLGEHPDTGSLTLQLMERDFPAAAAEGSEEGQQSGDGEGGDDPLATLTFAAGSPPTFTLGEVGEQPLTLTLAILLESDREPSPDRTFTIPVAEAVLAEERDHRLELGLQEENGAWGDQVPVMLHVNRAGRPEPSAPTVDDAREWTGWQEADRSTRVLNERTDARRLIRHNGEPPPSWREGDAVPQDGPTLHGHPIVRMGRREDQSYRVLLSPNGATKVKLKPMKRSIPKGSGHYYHMGWGLFRGGSGGQAYTHEAERLRRQYSNEQREDYDHSPEKALEALTAKALLLFAEGNPSSVNTWDSQVYTLAAGYAGAELTKFLQWDQGGSTTAALRELPWFDGGTNHLRTWFPYSPNARPNDHQDWSLDARRERLNLPVILKIVRLFSQEEHQNRFARYHVWNFYEQKVTMRQEDGTYRVPADVLDWAKSNAVSWWAGEGIRTLRSLLGVACYLRHGSGVGTPQPLVDLHAAAAAWPNRECAQLTYLLKCHAERLVRISGANAQIAMFERRLGRKVTRYQGKAREDLHESGWQFDYAQARSVIPALQGPSDEHPTKFQPASDEQSNYASEHWVDEDKDYSIVDGKLFCRWKALDGRGQVIPDSPTLIYNFGTLVVPPPTARRRSRGRRRRGS